MNSVMYFRVRKGLGAILIITVSTVFIFGCTNGRAPNGYFQSPLNNKFYGDLNRYDWNNTYYRINNDTIATYRVIQREIDSTVYVWDGKGYLNLGDEYIEVNNKLKKHYGEFGSGKYVALGENKIVFNNEEYLKKYRTYKDTTSIEAQFAKAKIRRDTLERISKKYFYQFLQEDKKKDSMLYHAPYITELGIQSSVNTFLKERINGNLYGKVIDGTLKIRRESNDKFVVQFDTTTGYYTKSHTYKFDGDMEGRWTIERIR
ncbi:hypothetical protein [Croceivirga sp. JEA036]|uniref:hypothetical protein n=1 Tax=Croceivirga sp. JEA036 TaxID=2721162 RepID=UPI00143899AE|nr:hypothetical protein [Croceivirga sp. JEA036]NJB35329.1 hypothetical protein [Croceivirga sp. JEA036]